MSVEDGLDGGAIGDIGMDEEVVGRVRYLGHRRQVAGVGELVDIDNMVAGPTDQKTADRRTDEARAAGDQYLHALFLQTQAFALRDGATPASHGREYPGWDIICR